MSEQGAMMSKRKNNVKQGPCGYCIGSNTLRRSWQVCEKPGYPALARLNYNLTLDCWEIFISNLNETMKANVEYCPKCGRLLPCL